MNKNTFDQLLKHFDFKKEGSSEAKLLPLIRKVEKKLFKNIKDNIKYVTKTMGVGEDKSVTMQKLTLTFKFMQCMVDTNKAKDALVNANATKKSTKKEQKGSGAATVLPLAYFDPNFNADYYSLSQVVPNQTYLSPILPESGIARPDFPIQAPQYGVEMPVPLGQYGGAKKEKLFDFIGLLDTDHGDMDQKVVNVMNACVNYHMNVMFKFYRNASDVLNAQKFQEFLKQIVF